MLTNNHPTLIGSRATRGNKKRGLHGLCLLALAAGSLLMSNRCLQAQSVPNPATNKTTAAVPHGHMGAGTCPVTGKTYGVSAPGNITEAAETNTSPETESSGSRKHYTTRDWWPNLSLIHI